MIRGIWRLVARRLGGAITAVTARYHRWKDSGHADATARAPRPAAWWSDDARWYPHGTPPRRHNRVTPLIDGAHYFPTLTEALRNAKRYVFIAGWCLTPDFPLDRHESPRQEPTALVTLLHETAARVPVRVLLWSGAQVIFEPSSRLMEAAKSRLLAGQPGDLDCRLDRTAHPTHCHHQKAIVIDGQVAFVGGMDLTTLTGDRWDTSIHPLRYGPNWHDVQLMIEGEAVHDVEENFRQRWTDSGGGLIPHQAPTALPEWQTPVQIVRTIPGHVYTSVRHGEFGIRHAYLQALRQARHLIYLENQYLWSPEVVHTLVTAVRRTENPRFRVVIVLPARAEDGKWDNDRHVSALRNADAGRGIVSIYTLYTGGTGAGTVPYRYRPTYVHAKVAVVDDSWCTVGSANLNDRGFFTDSEINAVVSDPAFAKSLRVDLWSEHLALARDHVASADPIDLVDHVWTACAARNRSRMARGERPLQSAVHRYETGHMPGVVLLEEVQVLTLDR